MSYLELAALCSIAVAEAGIVYHRWIKRGFTDTGYPTLLGLGVAGAVLSYEHPYLAPLPALCALSAAIKFRDFCQSRWRIWR